MKKAVLILFALGVLSFTGSGQVKTNDAISKQIRQLKSEKTLSLTYDPSSNVSKLMAVTENFSERDAGKAGVRAMNIAVGFMYPGQELKAAPSTVLLTFWVLTGKPRFADGHGLVLNGSGQKFDLGPARYVSKERQNMEYLNFEVPRAALEDFVGQQNCTLRLGHTELTFTKGQQKAVADLLAVSDPAR